MPLIHIKEISNKDGSTTIRADGGLDSDSIPVLDKVLQGHYNKKRKLYLEVDGLYPITRAGREFLMQIGDKATLVKIPAFIKLNDQRGKPQE
ncbi:MAG: hypothetical protein JRH15_11370 [Deltaproteobacteria bacterium]|nr:hypothetical protein [Deltaproteobacteria bacterium]